MPKGRIMLRWPARSVYGLLLTLLLIGISLPVYACGSLGKDIEERYQRACDEAPTTLAVIYAAEYAAKQWDEIRQEQYEQFLQLLDGAEKSLLQSADQGWRNYHDVKTRVDSMLLPDGQMYALGAADRMETDIKWRAKDYCALIQYTQEPERVEETSSKTLSEVTDEIVALEKEIDTLLARLLSLLEERKRHEDAGFVRHSQQIWLAFRDAEFAFFDAMAEKGVRTLIGVEEEKKIFINSRKSCLEGNIYHAELQMGLRSRLKDLGMVD